MLEGKPYPYRGNSLNLFRLGLAAIVLFAHSWYIAGRGTGPQVSGENLGTWAVAGFFVLSGFLITRSRLRTSAGDYLLHRIARIYPAFLVCLLLTATVFGPLAALIAHGTLTDYLTTPETPMQYVWGNMGLEVSNFGIGTTLDTVPYPNVWNGSLWTLYLEFLCYLVVWVVGALAVFRRSVIPAAALFVISLLIWINLGLFVEFGLDTNFGLFFKLLPFFMGGACAYFIIEKFGLNRWIGIVSLVIAVVLIAFVPRWGGQVSAPFLAYGLLFLSAVIPQPSWISRNDISYGFYIYAWPVQQLVVLVGGARWGMSVYLALTVVGTTLLAAGSWYLIERPSMNRIRRRRSVPPLPVPV
ncbi:acyltransferase family protein [Microbacterium sp. Leaf320]|uniref:acyltransferase family protein n=1 Tax=Microbacterium sp. Leaf320 TaxID=1736334 RepID=UPI0006F6FF68|nr:acyltransferase [Microbacterium sp. Leaf320]KQQ68808.1 hypothetical protein ASF63_02125 [Microbacterium sp. Leaf320]